MVDGWLDQMILEIFSSLNDSMVLYGKVEPCTLHCPEKMCKIQIKLTGDRIAKAVVNR